jgi:hypothetical protein
MKPKSSPKTPIYTALLAHPECYLVDCNLPLGPLWKADEEPISSSESSPSHPATRIVLSGKN